MFYHKPVLYIDFFYNRYGQYVKYMNNQNNIGFPLPTSYSLVAISQATAELLHFLLVRDCITFNMTGNLQKYFFFVETTQSYIYIYGTRVTAENVLCKTKLIYKKKNLI